MNTESYLRCTKCAFEGFEREAQGLTKCPRCGTTGIPCLVADDVTVRINWHELRILGIWAENWAASGKTRDEGEMQRLVNVICGRLHAQYPDKQPLTMTGDLGDLKRWANENAGGMEIHGFSPDAEADPELEENGD